MNKMYENKLPKDLSPEEIFKLTLEIAKITHQRIPGINNIQSYEDTAQEIVTYLYEKSARGKTGMIELQETCTMPHFKNTLFMEARNSVNYILRKKKVQTQIYNTVSLDQPAYLATEHSGCNRFVKDVITDENEIHKSERNIDLNVILSNIDNTGTINNNIKIKYGDGKAKCIFDFNYRNLAKIYFDLSCGKKLLAKDFEGVLVKTGTEEELSTDDITPILSGFKKYIKDNNIITGGTY